MKFRTEFKTDKAPITLNPREEITAIGSCFAENVVARMRRALWEAHNPLGTLFNPLSIAEMLILTLSDTPQSKKFLDEKIFQDKDVWHSWWFDTKFSSTNPAQLLEKCDNAITTLRKVLENSGALIITFGTARCYWHRNKEIGIVANCHKMPSSDFECRRVSPEEISQIWNPLCDRIHNKFPDLKIIFTVSPVRHVKDGFVENTRSKATLALAVEEIIRNRSYCDYFPAYEILCDDLRDYRFYASDLVHPSSAGIEYIWEKFCERYLDKDGIERIREGENLFMRHHHSPIVEDSHETAKFRTKTEEMRKRFYST